MRLKLPLAIGAVCAGMLSTIALAGRVADAMSVPRRVETLEKGQETLAKRFDSMAFEVQAIKTGMDSSFTIIKDAMARDASSRMEISAMIKTIAADLNDMKRGSMKLEASVTSLQIQQDRFQEMLAKDKQ